MGRDGKSLAGMGKVVIGWRGLTGGHRHIVVRDGKVSSGCFDEGVVHARVTYEESLGWRHSMHRVREGLDLGLESEMVSSGLVSGMG